MLLILFSTLFSEGNEESEIIESIYYTTLHKNIQFKPQSLVSKHLFSQLD